MDQKRRDLTAAEIKTMIEELADKVAAGGMEAYGKLKMHAEELLAEMDKFKFDEKLKEIEADLAELMSKVSDEGKEIINHIHTRIDDLVHIIEEEVEELKETGLKAWVKNNKKYAIIGLVVIAGAAIIAANIFGVPTPPPAG